jgi:hypothetical protein
MMEKSFLVDGKLFRIDEISNDGVHHMAFMVKREDNDYDAANEMVPLMFYWVERNIIVRSAVSIKNLAAFQNAAKVRLIEKKSEIAKFALMIMGLNHSVEMMSYIEVI